MTRCYQGVNAYSAAHNVIANSVDQRVCSVGYRKLHLRVTNRSQSGVQEKFVVKKVYATSKKRRYNVPVSVRSSAQFLYSRTSERIPDFRAKLNNPDISLVIRQKKKLFTKISRALTNSGSQCRANPECYNENHSCLTKARAEMLKP